MTIDDNVEGSKKMYRFDAIDLYTSAQPKGFLNTLKRLYRKLTGQKGVVFKLGAYVGQKTSDVDAQVIEAGARVAQGFGSNETEIKYRFDASDEFKD